jgi:hypothetical protein
MTEKAGTKYCYITFCQERHHTRDSHILILKPAARYSTFKNRLQLSTDGATSFCGPRPVKGNQGCQILGRPPLAKALDARQGALQSMLHKCSDRGTEEHLSEHSLAGAGRSVKENALDLLQQAATVEVRLLQRQNHPVLLRVTHPFQSTCTLCHFLSHPLVLVNMQPPPI